jgi:hypothetical protein
MCGSPQKTFEVFVGAVLGDDPRADYRLLRRKVTKSIPQTTEKTLRKYSLMRNRPCPLLQMGRPSLET